MENRKIHSILLYAILVIFTGCSSRFATSTPKNETLSDAIEQSDYIEMPEEQVTTTSGEEIILTQILQYYDDAIAAHEEGDIGLAETKIDSASVIASQIDLDKITDPSLSSRYRSTLTSLFLELGKILNESDKISQEDPMAWLEDLTETDSEQFKNGQWSDNELKMIVKKIALRCDVPLDYNEKVRNSIYFFQTKGRKEMTKWLTRSGRYLPMIRSIFDEEDLPLDLVYLSMIESGFSPRAYSRARAVGLWQFIYSTGRLYGLKRTEWVDERRDPVKSTKAAAQHLKDLFKLYGDWNMVMAAYNCGAARITRQLQRDEHCDYWSMDLPPETKNYVPSFMAAVAISKAPELFGFEGIVPETPMDYDTVEVHPYTSLKQIAECIGADINVLRDHNCELIRDRVPSGKSMYTIKIPKGTKETFLSKYEKQPVEKYTPPEAETYSVKRGETLTHIAQKFGVSVSRLMVANNIKNASKLTVGQKLRIPRSSLSFTTPPSQQTHNHSIENSADINTSAKHIVKRNETLWLIARQFNTTVNTLQELNNMGNRTHIVQGQTILVPSSDSSSSDEDSIETKYLTYIVQEDDTLYDIAQKYNVSHKDIMSWNKIRDHRKLIPGQKLIIKLPK